ncbi:hypothetical protein JT26_09705 [Porphyromonas sp. COT-108 OH1349]|nr:hypothetical protein JT26_09705 [Porphyromonas sp. COT-108 OH1349]
MYIGAFFILRSHTNAPSFSPASLHFSVFCAIRETFPQKTPKHKLKNYRVKTLFLSSSSIFLAVK